MTGKELEGFLKDFKANYPHCPGGFTREFNYEESTLWEILLEQLTEKFPFLNLEEL